MKTVTINLYPYHELSDDAKKVALDKFNETNDAYYRTTEEFLKSAEKFLKLVDETISIRNYQLGPYVGNYISFDTNFFDVESLLVRESNATENLLAIPAIKDIVERYENYPITGNYTDYALCKELHRILNLDEHNFSIRKILEMCIEELCNDCQKQCEFELSELYFENRIIDLTDCKQVDDCNECTCEHKQPLFFSNGIIYNPEIFN